MKTYQFLVWMFLLLAEYSCADVALKDPNSDDAYDDRNNPRDPVKAPNIPINPQISSTEISNAGKEKTELPVTEQSPEPEDPVLTNYFPRNLRPVSLTMHRYHVVFSSQGDVKPLCQGALISDRWVIGSAICFKKYEKYVDSQKIVAIMGTSLLNNKSAVHRTVSSFVTHPDFDPKTGLNDLALIELDSFSDILVETPVVGRLTNTRDEVPLNKRCKFSSYSGNTLYVVPVNYVKEKDCAKPFRVDERQKLHFFCARLKNTQIIAANDEVLGSPLVCDDEIFGVKTKNSLFTAIYDLPEWIESVVLTMVSHTHNTLMDRMKSRVLANFTKFKERINAFGRAALGIHLTTSLPEDTEKHQSNSTDPPETSESSETE